MSPRPSMPWGEFSADPRDPAAATLRASDRDRDVVMGVLADAFADGRLRRDEYDERVDQAAEARELGQLPPLVADLVPQQEPTRGELELSSPEELRSQAVQHYEASRRNAATSLVVMTAMLTAIWFAVSRDGFYWPVFVIVFSAGNLARIVLQRKELIAEEQRKLEKKQRKALEQQQSKALDPPPQATSDPMRATSNPHEETGPREATEQPPSED